GAGNRETRSQAGHEKSCSPKRIRAQMGRYSGVQRRPAGGCLGQSAERSARLLCKICGRNGNPTAHAHGRFEKCRDFRDHDGGIRGPATKRTRSRLVLLHSGEVKHTTACKADAECIIYTEWQGALDLKPATP